MKKKFILPKFYYLLQAASQEGIEINAQVLQDRYDELVMFVYQEDAATSDRVAYRNTLLNIRVALAGLTEDVLKKKHFGLSAQCHRID
jgi:hypothetical protein